MILTRYYARKPLEIAHVRAARDILAQKYSWSVSAAQYAIHYATGHYSVDKIDKVDKIVEANGQPKDFVVEFKSSGGRTLIIDTRNFCPISIELDNKDDPPEPLLDSMQTIFGLEPLAEVTKGPASTAFIAHGFDTHSQSNANELARFLTLLGITCVSGRAFAPSRVSEKVTGKLAAHDLFFAIVTPQEDHTWLTQEIATAATQSKPLFILKQSGVELKTGILGDHEYIPFSSGELSKTFIPILEGINAIVDHSVPLFPWKVDSQSGNHK